MVDNIYRQPYASAMSISAETLFSLMAHPLRLRALLLMRQAGELCVCDLMEILGVSQPMVSRHLAQLRQNGVVSDRRQGQWVYYRISDSLPQWARRVLETTAGGVADTPPLP